MLDGNDQRFRFVVCLLSVAPASVLWMHRSLLVLRHNKVCDMRQEFHACEWEKYLLSSLQRMVASESAVFFILK